MYGEEQHKIYKEVYKMVKTHEIKLNTSSFNKLSDNDYIILQDNNIEKNDFILFKQIEIVDEEEKETGLYKMTQVKDTLNSEGLKEGYILIVLKSIY